MTALVAIAVGSLAVTVVLLDLALTGVRVMIRRRQRREQQLRPRASRAIARYVTVPGEPPRPASRAERAIFRDVALQALSDLRGSARDTLVELISQLGYSGEAMARLNDRRRRVRRRSAEELAMTATEAAVPALLTGLSDPDPLVRTSCARTLARVGSAEDAPLAAAIAERDLAAVPGAAAAVVLALGRSQPAALGPLLRPGAPAGVRMITAVVAGRLRLAELVPALRRCLRDEDEELAAAAAEGLGLIGDTDSAGDLQAMAGDEGRPAPVRVAAVTALGSLGKTASVTSLEPLLLAADWRLRTAAAQALAQLREPGTGALRRAVHWGPPEAREQAEAALAP